MPGSRDGFTGAGEEYDEEYRDHHDEHQQCGQCAGVRQIAVDERALRDFVADQFAGGSADEVRYQVGSERGYQYHDDCSPDTPADE